MVVDTDDSMDENGNVGAGWYVEGIRCKVGLGKAATVWDGEVVGVNGGLHPAPEDHKILILSDSQAAISAVRNAGCIGRARTLDLKEAVDKARAREARLGPNAVRAAG